MNPKQNSLQNEKIVTNTTTNWLGEDGIIRSIMHEKAIDTLETAKENIAAGIKLAGGKKRPVLLDMSKIKSMDKAARDYYSNSDKREGGDLVVGIVVNSPVSRIIGNFFLGFNKPTNPTPRLFTDHDKAIEWLKSFL